MFDRAADMVLYVCVFRHVPFVCVWFFYDDAGGRLKMRIFKRREKKVARGEENLGPLVFVYKSLIFHVCCHAAPFDHWPVCC